MQDFIHKIFIENDELQHQYTKIKSIQKRTNPNKLTLIKANLFSLINEVNVRFHV